MTSPVVEPTANLPSSFPIKVNGRAFRPPTEMTYERDMYIVQLLDESGLDKLVDMYNPLEEELSDVAKRMVIKAFSTGKMFRLLATALDEDGVEWSFAECDKNEQFFKKLTRKEDKLALQSSIVMVLMGFIVSGVLSSRTSRNYSLRPSASLPISNDPFTSVGVRSSTSASGATSSEPSPTTTQPSSPSS